MVTLQITIDRLESLVDDERTIAIGWAHVGDCADLDGGIDPRQKIIPDMLSRA